MDYSMRTYLKLIAIHIRAQLQYRASFMLDFFAMLLIGLAEFGSIALALERFDQVGGWVLGEVAFLYGLVYFSFGCMDMIFSGFDPRYFGESVRRGEFDKLLLRPIDITLQVLSSQFVLRRLGRMAQGIFILSIAFNAIEIHWTLGKLLFLPVVVLSQIFFFGGLFVAGATFSFWTIESIEAVNIFTYGGSEMISYPMHIYQQGLRRFFTYILPAIFMNYYPALYFLEKPDPFGFPAYAPFLSPLVGVGIFLIAMIFWNFGLRYYQSTGT